MTRGPIDQVLPEELATFFRLGLDWKGDREEELQLGVKQAEEEVVVVVVFLPGKQLGVLFRPSCECVDDDLLTLLFGRRLSAVSDAAVILRGLSGRETSKQFSVRHRNMFHVSKCWGVLVSFNLSKL